ncbi:MAG TPA: NAD-binding protein [Armatimonadota bacterium]|jgi:Trk K+ transport system NAD-binding subunit
MSGHYIVCGLGYVGFRTAALLRRLGHEVTVVALRARPELVRAARKLGVRVMSGDACDRVTLQRAGVRSAHAILVLTDEDLVNLEIALDANSLCPQLPVVLRLFDQALAQHLEGVFDLRRSFSIAELAAPSFAAAGLGQQVVGSFDLEGTLYIVGRALVHEGSDLARMKVCDLAAHLRLAAIAADVGGDRKVLHPGSEVPLAEGSRVTLVGSLAAWRALPHGMPREPEESLGERLRSNFNGSHWSALLRYVLKHAPAPLRLAFLALNAIIALSVFVFHAYLDLSFVDALYFIIQTVTTVGYGDIPLRHAPAPLKLYACMLMLLGSASVALLYSILTDFIVAFRFHQILGHQGVQTRGHVLVVGLGHVGYRVVEELRRAGVKVVAVERDPDGQFVEAVREHTTVLVGDGRTRDTLLKAGMERAEALIAATNNDTANLSAGLAARQARPGMRTVLRLVDAGFARKVEASLGIDVALSAASLSAPAFVASALHQDVVGAFVEGSRLFAVVQCRTPIEWRGVRPSGLGQTHQAVIILRRKAGDAAFSPASSNDPLTLDEWVVAIHWHALAPGEA